MKIALLVGANPQRSKGGPIVRLLPGSWHIEMQGIEDSILGLHLDGVRQPDIDGNQVINSVGCLVQVDFVKIGTESHVSAYARKVE